MNIEALFQFLPFLEKEISAPFSEGVLRLLFAVTNIIKMIFVIKLRFHEGRRSPVIIWLLIFFNLFISVNSINSWVRFLSAC